MLLSRAIQAMRDEISKGPNRLIHISCKPTWRYLLLPKLTLTVMVIFVLMFITGQTAQAHNWSNMVYNCESKGSPNPWYTNTGNGFYFGPQFTPGTWHSSGGGPVREMGDRNGRPMKSYSIQYIIRIAENTYRIQGPYAWPNCHGYL